MNLTKQELKRLAETRGTPLYVYDQTWLAERASSLLNTCSELSIKARYALKANPYAGIIKLFDGLGLAFDASSEFEAKLLIDNGVDPGAISLSSQQPPRDLLATLESGVEFVATSLHQLELVASSGWQGEVGVRVNPGIGSGHNRRTTTGGPNASFGIWHEYISEIIAWEKASGARITRLHIHIGSGGDEEFLRESVDKSLEIAEQLENVTSLDMGGGFKIARVAGEKETDIAEVLKLYNSRLEHFNRRTGRNLKLEIEPGTWLVGDGGYLISRIVDIVDTGSAGYTFLKLDTGMNDLLRPALYGAQHPISVLNDSPNKKSYVVVGHNCEAGDILTPAPGDPESIQPRMLNEASIGDLVAIGGVGAYGASMRAVGYNSYPSAEEILA